MRRLLLLSVIFLCTACAERRVPVEIAFTASFDGQPVSCDGAEIALSDLRFYVSDLALLDANGDSYSIALLDDDRFQSRTLALVDLEDGQAACSNGTAETHTVIRGTVAAGRYSGLRFTVGVPFDLNHADPMRARAPLNDSAMHWHWRSGYKFLRAGIIAGADGFWAHIGSTGCEGTVQNISSCRAPNRIATVLPDIVSSDEPIAAAIDVDLSAFAEGTDLLDGERSDCSSGPAESACGAVFESLGLEFGTGSAAGPQRVFRAAQ